MTRKEGQMLGTAELTVGEVEADKRARAAQTVAAKATDDEDRDLLLDMLGLEER